MIRISMEMPKNCLECFACQSDDYPGWWYCSAVDAATDIPKECTEGENRPDWCPLIDEHELPCFNCPLQPIRPTWQQGKAYCGQCGKRIPLKIKADYCHKCGRGINWLP